MSDIHASQPSGQGRPVYAEEPTRVTGWVGWIIFAGVTMIVLGAFSIIEGLVAVFQRSFYVATTNQLIVHVNYATWGWVHFGIGVAAVLVGFGVMTGQMWARVLGIAIAVISAIVNLAFIVAYPVWGIIIIAIDIVIIYALAVHGREMKYV
ncbi:MAG: hypothetical protein ACM32E_01570 [Gemmatimonadota bacterium]